MDFYINKTLYNGTPDNLTERLSKEVRTYELLDSIQVPFSRLDHDETASIESCMEVEKLLGIHICKNLFLCNAQKTKFYLLMMPGTPQPVPIRIGMKDLPDRPNLRKMRSSTKAIRDM